MFVHKDSKNTRKKIRFRSFIVSLHPSLSLKWYEINVKLVDMQNQVHGSIGFATQSRIMQGLSTI